MPATLSTQDKIEIVLIVGDNYYKTYYRDASEIFNNRHPEKNLHYGTVRKLLNKFNTFGDVKNNKVIMSFLINKKYKCWVSVI